MLPLAPKEPFQIYANPAKRCLAQTFLTAPVNRMVSKRARQGPDSRGNKGNVRNKVNDKKTTLGGKDAAIAARALTNA
jgi:hypothetical protein